MLLIAEIYLTVRAWRAGWKAAALIPIAATMFLGALLGATMSNSDSLIMLALLADLGCIGVLGLMGAKAPNSKGETVPVLQETAGE